MKDDQRLPGADGGSGLSLDHQTDCGIDDRIHRLAARAQQHRGAPEGFGIDSRHETFAFRRNRPPLPSPGKPARVFDRTGISVLKLDHLEETLESCS
jgi:hypothetical protein